MEVKGQPQVKTPPLLRGCSDQGRKDVSRAGPRREGFCRRELKQKDDGRFPVRDDAGEKAVERPLQSPGETRDEAEPPESHAQDGASPARTGAEPVPDPRELKEVPTCWAHGSSVTDVPAGGPQSGSGTEDEGPRLQATRVNWGRRSAVGGRGKQNRGCPGGAGETGGDGGRGTLGAMHRPAVGVRARGSQAHG